MTEMNREMTEMNREMTEMNRAPIENITQTFCPDRARTGVDETSIEILQLQSDDAFAVRFLFIRNRIFRRYNQRLHSIIH